MIRNYIAKLAEIHRLASWTTENENSYIKKGILDFCIFMQNFR